MWGKRTSRRFEASRVWFEPETTRSSVVISNHWAPQKSSLSPTSLSDEWNDSESKTRNILINKHSILILSSVAISVMLEYLARFIAFAILRYRLEDAIFHNRHQPLMDESWYSCISIHSKYAVIYNGWTHLWGVSYFRTKPQHKVSWTQPRSIHWHDPIQVCRSQERSTHTVLLQCGLRHRPLIGVL